VACGHANVGIQHADIQLLARRDSPAGFLADAGGAHHLERFDSLTVAFHRHITSADEIERTIDQRAVRVLLNEPAEVRERAVHRLLVEIADPDHVIRAGVVLGGVVGPPQLRRHLQSPLVIADGAVVLLLAVVDVAHAHHGPHPDGQG